MWPSQLFGFSWRSILIAMRMALNNHMRRNNNRKREPPQPAVNALALIRCGTQYDPLTWSGANVGLEDAAELGHLLRKALAVDTTNNIAKTNNQFVTLRQERAREIHVLQGCKHRRRINTNRIQHLGRFENGILAFVQRLYG